MVELNTKYKIGKRRFGLVNWVGFYTLYKKETLRFLIFWSNNSRSSSHILFLIVLSIAWGEDEEKF